MSNTSLLTCVAVAILHWMAASPASAAAGPYVDGRFQGRIAYSCDGNHNDPDDWAASPVTLAILAEAGLKERLVHFDYNCILPLTDPGWEKTHAQSVLGTAERYGFDKRLLFDCQKDRDGAIASIAQAIDNSTAANPLYFVIAGPMEVPYLGIRKSDPAKRQFVYCISHSRWNDGFASKYKFTCTKRSVIEQDVHWVQIRDQNRLLSFGRYGRPAAPEEFEPYSWMRDSGDSKVRWLWERMVVSTRPDPSDAGMTWFLATGDEECDPVKLRRLIDEHRCPAPMTARPQVRIEAENFRHLEGCALDDRNDKKASHALSTRLAGGNTGSIRTRFDEPFTRDGASYDVEILHFDAKDSRCRLTLSVNGAAQGAAWESPGEGRGWMSWTIREVTIRRGDEIRVDVQGDDAEAGKLDYVQLNDRRGHLRVHPENPRYFTDGSGKAIYLTGSHTWNNFQHNGVYPSVNYDEYLDFLQRHNHNFIRLWVWEQGGWDPWAKDHVPVGPLAYARTGPGQALDGQPKYDLTRFNDEYFARLRTRVQAAGDRGIYVSVMLFEGWSVEKKGQVGNPWQGHPFNKANNVNGIDGDLNGDGQGPEIHTLSAPRAILDLQQAYVRRVIDTLNDLDNVLYEIGNEMHTGSVQWQYRMIGFIHAYQNQKPKQHPVGMTGAPIDNAALLASPADWIAPTSKDGYNTAPPAADGRKVILSDVDHVWPRNFPQWPWKSFTQGLNTAFMDLYGATKIGDKEIKELKFVGDWRGNHETARQRMGHTLALARRVNLAAMTPQGALASTGYCLANAKPQGAEYLVYLPDGGNVTVDLSKTPGTLAVEWIDAGQGGSTPASEVEGGAVRSFKAPFGGDAVLYLCGRR